MLSLFGQERVATVSNRVTGVASIPRRRIILGFGLSLSFHVAVGATVLPLTHIQAPRIAPAVRSVPPRLVSLVYIPDAPETPLPLRAKEPIPHAKVAIKTEEPLPELPKPLPERTIESSRADIAPPPEKLPVEAPPKPVLPKPAPAVTVGAFANNAVVRTEQPNRELEKVAFDNHVANPVAPVHTSPATSLGGFDRPVKPAAKPDSHHADTVVSETAFGRAETSAPSAPQSQVVREAGFGVTNNRERPRAAEAEPIVKPSGFDSAPAAQIAAKTTPQSAPKLTPVEVLSKPTPVYTEEARQLKIEGDITLEVEFTSTGSVRVLRVVHGLGHGLDEAAAKAAEQIRFKPAQDHGQPVDFRTTVHIVFRLA